MTSLNEHGDEHIDRGTMRPAKLNLHWGPDVAKMERVVSAARAVKDLRYSGEHVPMKEAQDIWSELLYALAALDSLSTR